VTAILIDATLVRLVLVPALMTLLRRWKWWLPGTGDGRGRWPRFGWLPGLLSRDQGQSFCALGCKPNHLLMSCLPARRIVKPERADRSGGALR
jgi:hypothetical protein